MSDEQKPKEPPRPLKLSSLRRDEPVDLSPYVGADNQISGTSDAAGAVGEARKVLDAIENHRKLAADISIAGAIRGLNGPIGAEDLLGEVERHRKRLEEMARPSGEAQKVFDQITQQQRLLSEGPFSQAVKGFSGADDLMRQVREGQKLFDEVTRPHGVMQQVYNDLEEQRKRINAIQGPLEHVPELKPEKTLRMPSFPPNPAVKTNKKLEEIGAKFEQMLSVMTSAANIATDIQGHATDFLEKFDKASEQTDRATRNALRIAVVAMILSVITALIPIGVSYFWPDKTAATLENLVRQLVNKQESDRDANEQLIQALRQDGHRTGELLVETLRESERQSNKLLEELLTTIKQHNDVSQPH
jgi:hypothetical protein